MLISGVVAALPAAVQPGGDAGRCTAFVVGFFLVVATIVTQVRMMACDVGRSVDLIETGRLR